jgi:hypothetical protein
LGWEIRERMAGLSPNNVLSCGETSKTFSRSMCHFEILEKPTPYKMLTWPKKDP